MKKDITPKDITEYLNANPDFFEGRDSLLMKLKMTHKDKGAISLVEKQMEIMRDRQKKAQKRLKEFLSSAERNKEIFDKCRQMILNLIAANGKAEFFDALEKGLRKDFGCKAWALVVLGKEAGQINKYASRVTADTARQHAGTLMRAREPTLGVLRPKERDFLFQQQSKHVKSAAILSVRERNKQIALLAIGHGDPHYFSSDLDTLFIGFVADVLAKLLPRHLSEQP